MRDGEKRRTAFHPVLSVFDTKELAKVNNKSNGCASGMPNLHGTLGFFLRFLCSKLYLKNFVGKLILKNLDNLSLAKIKEASRVIDEILENEKFYQIKLFHANNCLRNHILSRLLRP